MSNYIKYYSPEWKRISQCLVKLGIYGTRQCDLNKNKLCLGECGGIPALLSTKLSIGSRETRSLIDEAIALLQEKYPEYDWSRDCTHKIQGVLL